MQLRGVFSGHPKLESGPDYNAATIWLQWSVAFVILQSDHMQICYYIIIRNMYMCTLYSMGH